MREDLQVEDVVLKGRPRRRQRRDHVDRIHRDRIANWQKTRYHKVQGRSPKRWYEIWTSAGTKADITPDVVIK